MAKSFRFPLQKVLNYRQVIEDSQSTILKKSKLDLFRKTEHLEKLVKHKNNLLNKNSDYDEDHISIFEMKVTKDYINQIGDRIEEQKQHITKSINQVEKDKSELVKAARNKKVFEKLKEKQHDNFKKTNRRTEIIIESEIALKVVERKRRSLK